MSFLNKIFNNSNQDQTPSEMNWVQLRDLNQLDEIINLSQEKPVAIFKHSTRCSISRMALKQFEKEYNIAADKMELYFLDLLEFRPISNEVAERFEVEHQSPQVLVIRNGVSVYDTSHDGIQAEKLHQFI